LTEGDVAIVTGAGRGVGRATAIALAAAGHPVGLISRTAHELDVTAAEIERSGGRVVAAAADVTDEAAVGGAFHRIESALGPAGILVTMAGVAQTIGPVWQVDPEAWWSDVESNLRGTFLACRRALPSMIAAGAGRIVTVSTYGLNRPMPYLSAYASAKGGVSALAEALHAEVTDLGIKVFLITPGTARTRLLEQLATSPEGLRWLPSLAERTDTVAPEVGAQLVVRLVSGDADPLAGRFLHALDDIDDLLSRVDEIIRDDAYALRIRRLS
jgi:NAD(P)-dependent dehydrogenase (short-subunit alcohol dehydrogenase family)